MTQNLITERLVLTPFSLQDQELFHQINTDPFVRKFLWDDKLIDEGVSSEVIKKNELHFKNDQYGLWKIIPKVSQEVIGYVGLWYFFDEPQPQLIYALLKSHTKKGYATESGQAVIDYAINTLGFEYLIAATDESHRESQAVAQRLGMSFAEKRVEEGKPTLFFRIERK